MGVDLVIKVLKFVTMSMKKNSLFINLIGCLFLLLWVSCSDENQSSQNSLPFYSSANFTPHWFNNSEEIPKDFHQISTFKFHDQLNRVITEKNLDGKITLVHYFFSSCGLVCPKLFKNLKPIQDKFQNDSQIQVFSFTVTPWIDSVSRLNTFGIKKQLNPRFWHLLTGNKNEIYLLARNQFFVEGETGLQKDSNDFLHTENVLLIDANRHIRGIYHGTIMLDEEMMEKDILQLKEEANRFE